MKLESQEQWQEKRLAMVPAAWRGRVEKKHGRAMSRDMAAGNMWLLELTEGLSALRVPVTLSDSELIELATKRAAEAMGHCEVAPGVFLTEPAALRSRLVAYVGRYGIAPPEPLRITRKGTLAGVTDAGAIARMCCPMWWRRKLRQGQARALEGKAIELGYVHRRGEIYASDATVARRQQQRARNAAGLEQTEAINRDTGEVYRLADLAAASVANPRIRRGELMTRIAGFEAVAVGVGHAGEFVTLTAPSSYHSKRTGDGGAVQDNPKYSGATPRQAQGYLARLWANIRAKLYRVGISPYGFRIAEPHHDATPHWHLLLFMASEAVAKFREIFTAYALREDGDEAGAREARVTFKAIDWKKGSAAGYVAKYVSKNIDGGGYQVQGDTEGGPGDIFPGHRVEAWASTWGIRQFQQVGGPPVGVWRELRRLEAGKETTATVEAARAAADCGRSGHDETGAAGNWRRFVEVMGGPSIRRKDRPLSVARCRDGERFNYAAGEVEPANSTRYGEVAKGAVYGVLDRVAMRGFATVRHRWEIRGKQATGRSGGQCVAVEHSGPVGSEAGALYRPIAGTGAGNGAGLVLGFGSPWSPVNNCSPAILPELPWEVLRLKTAESERGIWLDGAAFSAWVAKGGDCGRSQGIEAGGSNAGRGGEPGPVGHAAAIRCGAGGSDAGRGDGAGAGSGAGVGIGGAGRSAGA